MKTQTLFITTAALEIATGIALVAMPDNVLPALLGTALDAHGALVVARIAGLALLTLGLACWLARRDEASPAGRGLIAAMLLYNVAVAALLAWYGVGSGPSGIGLWPVVLVHSILAGWCIMGLLLRDPSTSGIQRS